MVRVLPEAPSSPVSQGAQPAARPRDPQSGGFSALVDDNAQNIDRSAQRASADRAPDAPRPDNRDLPARADNAAPASADRNASSSQRTDAPKTGKSDDGTGHHSKTKGTKTDRADQDTQAAANTDAATVAPADPATTIIMSGGAANLAASGGVVAQADGAKSDAASTGDDADAVITAIATPVAAVNAAITAAIPVIPANTQATPSTGADATAIQSVATSSDAPAAAAALPADASVAVDSVTDVTAKAAKSTTADVLAASSDAATADPETASTETPATPVAATQVKTKNNGGTVIDSALSTDAKDAGKPAALPLPAQNADAGAPREADAPQHGKHSAVPDKSESAATDAQQAATPTPVEHRAPVAAHASVPGDSGAPQVQVPQPPNLQTPNLTVTPAQINTALASTPVPVNGIAVDIALRAAGGASRFEIRLDPAELGRIDVRLDVDRHGNVTSHLTVEKPATLDMLRQDAPRLQQALEDAGLKTGDSGLQFSLRDQSSSNGRGDEGSGRNAHRLIIGEDDTVPAQIAGRTYGRAPGSGSGVDIRV